MCSEYPQVLLLLSGKRKDLFFALIFFVVLLCNAGSSAEYVRVGILFYFGLVKELRGIIFKPYLQIKVSQVRGCESVIPSICPLIVLYSTDWHL
ncbi:MAG: hypothetical protein QOF73_78 [Thermomicrobiales bacterium]|nr:hypothetical protein [Thermomicrobiales bacterium]